jgi:hypothetical protein
MTANALRKLQGLAFIGMLRRSATFVASRLDGLNMSDHEVDALVEELEALGVKFTVIPRIDGSLRLNTWRMQGSWLNRDQINRVLAERIERAPGVADRIAQLISRRSAQTVSNPSAT